MRSQTEERRRPRGCSKVTPPPLSTLTRSRPTDSSSYNRCLMFGLVFYEVTRAQKPCAHSFSHSFARACIHSFLHEWINESVDETIN